VDDYLIHRRIALLKRLKKSVEDHCVIHDISVEELSTRLDVREESIRMMMTSSSWSLERTVEIILKLDLRLDISNVVGEG